MEQVEAFDMSRDPPFGIDFPEGGPGVLVEPEGYVRYADELRQGKYPEQRAVFPVQGIDGVGR